MKYKDSYKYINNTRNNYDYNKVNLEKRRIALQNKIYERELKKSIKNLFIKIAQIDKYWTSTVCDEERWFIYNYWIYGNFHSIHEFIHKAKKRYGNVERARELKIDDLIK